MGSVGNWQESKEERKDIVKVLVTGATGRIGRSLIRQIPSGIDVEILLDPLDQYVPEYSWLRADIGDRNKVIMGVTCSKPDVVIHLAAMTDVDGCEEDSETAFRVNRDGTAYIAEACSRCGAKLVYLSTDYVFDGRMGPYTEEDKTHPISVYGRSKLEGEIAASGGVDNSLIVRISVPFGVRREGVNHNFVSWLVEELGADSTVPAVVDQYTTPAFMEELSEILWVLIRKDIRGTIHYGTSDRLSRYEMACELCRIMGVSEDLVTPVKTDELGLLAKRPLESGFVTDRLHDIIGRPPILYRHALYRIIEAAT